MRTIGTTEGGGSAEARGTVGIVGGIQVTPYPVCPSLGDCSYYGDDLKYLFDNRSSEEYHQCRIPSPLDSDDDEVMFSLKCGRMVK